MNELTTFSQLKRQSSSVSNRSINDSCVVDDPEDGVNVPAANAVAESQRIKQKRRKSSNEENLLEEDEKEHY